MEKGPDPGNSLKPQGQPCLKNKGNLPLLYYAYNGCT